MRTISVLEIARRLGVCWRTARARVEDGTVPGRTHHPTARRGYVVLRQVFEKWLQSTRRSHKSHSDPSGA